MKAEARGMAAVRQRIALLLATGFGLGYAPLASGTVGTLPGILLLLLLKPLWHGGLIWPLIISAGLTLLAIPICDVAEKIFQRKDDGRIVADEYLTFPICMLGLPLQPWLLVTAFFTARLCDIIKPFPARRLQNLPGGWGIVADDAFANLYSLALNHLIYWLARHFLNF